jgi:hypothetical protein
MYVVMPKFVTSQIQAYENEMKSNKQLCHILQEKYRAKGQKII